MKKTVRMQVPGVSEELFVIPGFPDYALTETGKVYSFLRNTFIYGRKGSDGRQLHTLRTRGKKFKHILLSTLTYKTLLGPIPKGFSVNHIDHDHTNDHHTNLQIVSPSNNARMSAQKRRFKGHAFNDHSVREVRRLYKSGKTQTQLAGMYGVNRRTIQKLVKGTTYANV